MGVLKAKDRRVSAGSCKLVRSLVVVVGGLDKVRIVNRGDLHRQQESTVTDAAESRSHKATGVCGEVRVTHSSRSVGKPRTWRRSRQDQSKDDARNRR